MQEAWQEQQDELVACGLAYAVARCYMLQILEVTGYTKDARRAEGLRQLWDLCGQSALASVDFVLDDMDNWMYTRWRGKDPPTDPQLTDCFCSLAELVRAVAYGSTSEFEEGRLLLGFKSLSPEQQLHEHDVWIRNEVNAYLAIMKHFEWAAGHPECLVGRVKREPALFWQRVSRLLFGR